MTIDRVRKIRLIGPLARPKKEASPMKHVGSLAKPQRRGTPIEAFGTFYASIQAFGASPE